MEQVARSGHSIRRDRGTIQLAVGVLLLGGLAFGGCDAQSTRAHTSAETPTATPNLKGAETPETPAPTPIVPYTFPTAWRAPSGGPSGVSGFAFAPSAPRIGYACSGISSGQPGTPTPPTGGPALEVTHDGGTTWQALRTLPFAQGHGCGGPVVDETDPNDIFVATSVPFGPPSGQYTFELWRSRDGGATWAKLASPDPNDPVALMNLTVVGGRIIVDVEPEGAGMLPYYIISSDDGGATWAPVGQSLLTQRDSFGPTFAIDLLVAVGPTLYVTLNQNCRGGCREVTPAPGQAQPGEYRSTDRGDSWRPASLPGYIAASTRTPSGAYYVLGIQVVANGASPEIPYWSRDGGATWKALPTMEGVEGGFVDPTMIGSYGLAIAPDGTIITGPAHRYADNQITPAGFFSLRATDAAPSWKPLAPPGAVANGVSRLQQAVATSSGIRLWGIEYDAPLGPRLVYVDLP